MTRMYFEDTRLQSERGHERQPGARLGTPGQNRALPNGYTLSKADLISDHQLCPDAVSFQPTAFLCTRRFPPSSA